MGYFIVFSAVFIGLQCKLKAQGSKDLEWEVSNSIVIQIKQNFQPCPILGTAMHKGVKDLPINR